jgi:hypothetical protein
MVDQIEISYKNGSWTDISGLCTEFTVEDSGILKVPTATIALHSDYTNLLALLTAYHKDIRILIKPYDAGSPYRIFYGNIWEIPQAVPELSNAVKLSAILECRGFAQRLADDTITWDYYALQAANSPHPYVTYAETDDTIGMIDDMLFTPDSGYDTGIVLDVPSGGAIHDVVDRSATFDRQSLLDAVRGVCDRIGYDGYFELTGDVKTIFLRPFGTGSSVVTLTHPFLSCKWDSGSLDDVVNYVLVHGGVDEGLPIADKYTEFGVTKFTPPIWTAACVGATPVLTDEDNTIFTQTIEGVAHQYGANYKCIKVIVDKTDPDLWLTLRPNLNPESDLTVFDCKNRLRSLTFAMVPICPPWAGVPTSFFVTVHLIDLMGNRIWYKHGLNNGLSVRGDIVYQANIPVGPQEKIKYARETSWLDWFCEDTATTFDWANVYMVQIEIKGSLPMISGVWGFYLDNFRFIGGISIDPFAEYADILDPPVKDVASINACGVHLLHAQDTLITTFEQAQNEGNRILANLKKPIKTLELKQPAKLTAIKPCNLVTVTIPQLNINAEEWRVIGLKYNWNSRRKTVHQTFSLTSKLDPLPPIWSSQPELRSAVR